MVMAMYRGRHRNVDEYAAAFADAIEWTLQSDSLPSATLDHDPTRYLPRLRLTGMFADDDAGAQHTA